MPAEDALLATAVDAEQRSHAFAVRHATLDIGFSVGALRPRSRWGSARRPASFSCTCSTPHHS
jgi:hypothetical protein